MSQIYLHLIAAKLIGMSVIVRSNASPKGYLKNF